MSGIDMTSNIEYWYYRWKCQSCGYGWWRKSKGEPKLPCYICRDKGVKSYVGKRKSSSSLIHRYNKPTFYPKLNNKDSNYEKQKN